MFVFVFVFYVMWFKGKCVFDVFFYKCFDVVYVVIFIVCCDDMNGFFKVCVGLYEVIWDFKYFVKLFVGYYKV